MLASLILAAALTAQSTPLPPMSARELAAYKQREGFTPIKSIESPKQRALQRKYDAWNRKHARSVADLKFTPAAAIRFAWKYPPGSPYWRYHR